MRRNDGQNLTRATLSLLNDLLLLIDRTNVFLMQSEVVMLTEKIVGTNHLIFLGLGTITYSSCG